MRASMEGRSRKPMSVKKPPHPATVAQPRSAMGQPPARPPHPATVAQPRASQRSTAPSAPHPAKALQPRPSAGQPLARAPHPATVAQRRQSPAGLSAQRAAQAPSVLVVGCGKKMNDPYRDCKIDHHAAGQLTIDARPAIQPDVVGDFGGDLKDSGLKEKSFEKLVFERVDTALSTRPQAYNNAYALLKPGGVLMVSTGRLVLDRDMGVKGASGKPIDAWPFIAHAIDASSFGKKIKAKDIAKTETAISISFELFKL